MKLAGSPCGRGEGHCKSHEECAAVSLLSCIDMFILYISDCNIDQGLQCGNHNCRSKPMNESKSLFNISILTADICMLSITPNMLTKPWNYLKKQIPAVGTHTWTAYIKVTNIRGDPVLVCSQNWLQALGTILYSYSFHNCRCHSWRIQWMVECQQSIPKKTSATL